MPGRDEPFTSQRRRFGWVIASITCLTFLIVAVSSFLYIGRWLVDEDSLSQADAIVVLSGRMPLRALEAARLYNMGFAPQIWLTRGNEPAASLQQMHIVYIGEDFYDAQVLRHERVPSNAIHFLEPVITNTSDEIRLIASELQRIHGHTVIIVTSKAHTRRVHTLWRELSAGTGQAIIRAASTDGFDENRWWRNTTDTLEVVREALGLLNAWAGLPLKPSESRAR